MTNSNGPAANQSLFHLTIPELECSLTVLGFHSKQHALCGHYEFIIEIAASNKQEIDRYLGKQAVLSLYQQTFIHGGITEVSSNTLCLASPLYYLQLTAHNKVYRNLTLPELIDAILIQTNMARIYECALRSGFNYSINGSYTQYNESDFDFLQRHLFRWGFIFYFEQSPTQIKLIITDEMPIEAKEHSLPLVVQTNLITDDEVAFGIQSNLFVESDHARINNYDPSHPTHELYLTSQNLSGLAGHGMHYYYGEPYTTIAAGKRLLTIRQQCLDSLRFRVTVHTTKCNLQPGDILHIAGAETFTLAGDGRFRILSIDHRGDQRAGSADAGYGADPHHLSYFNRLTLIEAQQSFRPIYTPMSPANYQVAMVENIVGEFPYLDEQGCYHIRYPFDGDNPKGNGSHAIRMLQPHSGKNSGHHWPLHDGTQVVIGYVNGDIDQPIILGVLPHTKMPGPVTHINKTQHILCSWAGHRLLMEDQPKHSSISLNTRQGQALHLDAAPNQHQIALISKKGDLSIKADQNFLMTSASQQHAVDHHHHVQAKKSVSLTTQEGDITIQCQHDLHFQAGQNIHINTQQGNLNLQSTGNMLCHAQRGSTITTQKGNFQICAKEGHIQLKARHLTLTNNAKASITITQGQGSILIEPSGIVHIKAPTIEFQGPANLEAPEIIYE